jgi:hypothetical protein
MRLWKDANMPHVDEGEMHALLDGAFAHDAPAAARIREEIATCAECKERFDEAQALRMRAGALLDRALPRPATPPFESVIERAGTVEAPRPFRFPAGAPLAWAATIVLALGLGWFGRDWLRTPPATSRVAEQERAADTRESTAPAQPVTAQVETVAAPPPAAPPSVTPQPPAAMQRAQVQPRRSEPVADLAGGAGSTAGQRNERRDEGAAKAAAGRAANTVGSVAAARDSAARSADQVRQRAAGAPAPPAAAPAERVAATSAFAKDASTEWENVTAAQAERMTGRRVLIVPGLTYENVGVTRIDGRYVTRVIQRLPDGNTIEIVQEMIPEADRAQREELRSAVTPQAARPDSKDELGVTVVKVTRVGWVLTGRATLSQDSLRALLNSAR